MFKKHEIGPLPCAMYNKTGHKYKYKTIKLPEENICGNDFFFLDLTPKSNKWNYIKLFS